MACNHSGSNSMYRVPIDGRKHNLFHICLLHKAWAGSVVSTWEKPSGRQNDLYTNYIVNKNILRIWDMNSTPKRKLSDWRTRKGKKTSPRVAPKERKNQAKIDNKCLVARCCKTPNTNIEPYPVSKKMNVLTCYNMALAKTCEEVLAHTWSREPVLLLLLDFAKYSVSGWPLEMFTSLDVLWKC